jgi:glycine cleavage system H protein
MSEIPNDLKYTKSHEWVRDNGDGTLTIGITDHAQDLLGDLVFVELPEKDAEVSALDAMAVVESVKAASDVYAPMDGTVVDVNEALVDAPELVNSSPYNEGWLYSLAPADTAALNELLDADAYSVETEE